MHIKGLPYGLRRTYLLLLVVLTAVLGFAARPAQAQQAAGDRDPQLLEADSLYEVAGTHYWESRYAEAESLFVRVLTLREALLGPDHIDVALALNDLALVYQYQGRYDEAELNLQRTLAIWEQAVGPDHLEVAATLTNLGVLYYDQSNYTDAEPMFERALAIWSQARGPEHPQAVTLLVNLARVYEGQGRYADAVPLYEQALAIREKTLGPEHPDVAMALILLGNNYLYQGAYDQVEPLYQRVLQIREKALGPEDPTYADALINLAFLYVEQGRYDEAEPLYQHTLTLQEQTIGTDHPRYATTLNNLAQLYQEQGRYDEAEQLYDRALALLEQGGERRQLDLARTLSNIANLYLDQGRYDEAEPPYLRALTIQEDRLGPDHPDVATTLNNLALLYHWQGRYGAIEPLYRRALAIKERIYGWDHPEYANTLSNLGLLLIEMGQFDEAEGVLTRSLDIRTQSLGPDHPSVGISLVNLAALYEDKGRFAEAEPLYQQALDLMKKALGADHVNVTIILDNLARLYVRQSRYDEAEAFYKESLDLEKRALGADHPALAGTINGLAVIYQYQERHDEAEPLLREALAIQEKAPGRETLGYVTGLNNLATLYSVQERYDEATTLFEEALALYEHALGADHPAITHTLLGLAENRLDAGQLPAAMASVNQALDVFNATPGYNPIWEVKAYSLRAQLHKQNGRHDEAIRDLERALRLVERVRPKIGGGEQTRAAFFTPYAHYFDDIVAWHLEAGDLESAFEYAERGRARVLLDQLAAGQVDLLDRIPPDIRAALEARQAQAGARLAEFQQRLTLLRARTDLSEEAYDLQHRALKDSLAEADQAYRQVDHDIKNASPLWRSYVTSGGQPQDLADVQDLLVPAQGLMVLYQIGHEQSHVFVIPPYGQPLEVLPLHVTEEQASVLGIEAGALTSEAVRRSLGLFEIDTEETSGLFRQMTTRGTKVVRGVDQASPVERLHALWQVLTPAALWPRLVEAAEVVLVPDEALHYLPFEALIVEPGEEEATPRYWLDDGPVLRYAPSATALYNIMDRSTSGELVSATEAAVLSLSNPIFDPRAVAAAGEGEATDSVLLAVRTRDSYERLGGSFAALPGTARETEAITTAFGEEAVRALQTLQGLNATEANLRRVLAGKRYLHLATHGLVDEGRGALFASLVLTPPPHETDDLANDGFLQLHEIYTLPLSETELAVLSACKSNVGPRVAGEGVFALSRGFLAAGARRVVASQWAVDDASTAALMGAFFDVIVTAQRAGRRIDYARALRDAKRLVRSQERWNNPYHWAPFILTGQE